MENTVENQLVKYADKAFEDAMRASNSNSVHNILENYEKSLISDKGDYSLREWTKKLDGLSLPEDWHTYMCPVAVEASERFRKLSQNLMNSLNENHELFGFKTISVNGFIRKDNNITEIVNEMNSGGRAIVSSRYAGLYLEEL